MYQVLVVGGGPAGMTATVYCARKMVEIGVLAGDFGGQVAWTSAIENYPGFQIVTGAQLTAKFRDQVASFHVPLRVSDQVTEIVKDGDAFVVTTGAGAAFLARAVILATGKRHRPLDVPGEARLIGKGVVYCSVCDAPFFKDRTVVVAGGGNSGITAAIDLMKIATHVTVLNITNNFQADPVMLETARSSDRVTLMGGQRILSIEGKDRVSGVVCRDEESGEVRQLPADGVFVEIGLLPNSRAVAKLARLNRWGEVEVDSSCRTSVDGLFAAGDVSDVPYKQIIVSAGEGSKAALAAYDYLIQKGFVSGGQRWGY